MAFRQGVAWLAAAALAAPAVHADAGLSDDALDRLLALSLEELDEVKVTTASPRAERLSDAPASVFVIHRDDIRRLGIHSLPEALRLAPNLQVARINASSHAVTARGLKTDLGNKLLVMIDGRSISPIGTRCMSQSTPANSGVYTGRPSIITSSLLPRSVLSPRAVTAWLEAFSCATCRFGARRSASGSEWMPSARISSRWITNTDAGASASRSARGDAVRTSTSPSSSRLSDSSWSSASSVVPVPARTGEDASTARAPSATASRSPMSASRCCPRARDKYRIRVHAA